MTGMLWLILAAALLHHGTAFTAAPEWSPSRQVEIVVPSGPGGSLDRTGRSIHKLLLDRNYVSQGVVINRPGAGGGLAVAYAMQHPGDPHYLVVGSSSMVASYITGGNTYNYLELTPIALLLNDYVAFAVPPDSPVKDGRDMIDRLRRDPSSLSVSIGTGLGGSAHIALGLAMKRAGVEVTKLKVVAFKSGGESLAAVLGAHVHVIASSPGNIVNQARSGKLRVIAISSPVRLKGDLAGAPTWKELGVDSTYANWRGVAGSRNLGRSQIAFWDSVFGRLVQAAEWRRDLERNLWSGEYLDSSAYAKFLADEFGELKALLTDLSLAKK